MKNAIFKAIDRLPVPLKAAVVRAGDHATLVLETAQDAARFWRYGGPPDRGAEGRLNDRNLEAQLMKDYHRIEKGLSFRSPRRPFGHRVAQRLNRLSRHENLEALGNSRELQEHVSTALSALETWNESQDVDDLVAPKGSQPVQLSSEQAASFFTSRHSLRNFDRERPVDPEIIREAIVLAGTSPSVCNRQAVRYHFFSADEDVSGILRLQAGSAGFAETIPHLIVVTVETGLFTGTGERNQRWIDGGLAAMTLVWAFHSLGVHSCMLNWSKKNGHSRRLRALTNIPDSEEVICVVAFGYPPSDGFRVARSAHRSIEEISTGI